MKVAIVKYNAGNICSVVNALQRLGVSPLITDKAEELQTADKVLLPGQGEASGTMAYLRAHGLDRLIKELRQPVLGICIGQQLMCRHTEEGDVDCLGIFDVDVKRFQPARHEDKVPHMGWNRIDYPSPCVGKSDVDNIGVCGSWGGADLLKGVSGEFVYFVHSFYVPLCEHTIGVTDYILPVSAALQKDNFYATQFHPEKSGRVGERILKNFLEIAH